MTTHASTLWALPLLPVIGAVLLLALRRVEWARLTLPMITLVATSGGALLLGSAAPLPAAPWPGWGGQLAPALLLAGPGRVMAVLIPIVAIPVLAYAAASMRHDMSLPRLLVLLLVFVGAMELLVCAADFLTLLIAWELVGACSWGLIGHEWRDRARPSAARDAFLTTRAGDLGLYLAAAATIGATGTLRFVALDALVHGPASGGIALQVVAAGVLFAAAAKSAQLPFSPWLFSAMAGPTPASALLHSATMVAAGAYLLIRLQPVLASVPWFPPAVAALGLATALAGGIVAAAQSDLKRALAASTSAQYGLMLVALGAGFPSAAMLHLVAHALFKALLFLGAGAALHAAGTLDLRRLAAGQLGRALPWAATLFAVGTLALGGVPPLGGAYSKEAILAAASQAGAMAPWLVPGVLVAGLLSALYAARLQLLGFARRDAAGDAGAPPGPGAQKEGPRPIELAGMGLLASLSLALGIFWLPGAPLAVTLAAAPLPASAWWELRASVAFTVAGAGASWMLWRRGRLATLALPEPIRVRIADWLGLPFAARQLVVTPTLALARTLARVDDRGVDAGIRLTARVATAGSRVLDWWMERGVDGVVRGIARATLASATMSGEADDRGVDGAVEGVARGVGVLGTGSRRLQTGMAHHYYLIVAVGVLALAAAAGVASYVFALRPTR